jgi:hypothetical protein
VALFSLLAGGNKTAATRLSDDRERTLRGETTLTETNFTDSTSWTAEEEAIVARIMATETMHDPENYSSDRRIACTRPEALRRLQRRKVGGIYREPTGQALVSATGRIPPDSGGWHRGLVSGSVAGAQTKRPLLILRQHTMRAGISARVRKYQGYYAK